MHGRWYRVYVRVHMSCLSTAIRSLSTGGQDVQRLWQDLDQTVPEGQGRMPKAEAALCMICEQLAGRRMSWHLTALDALATTPIRVGLAHRPSSLVVSPDPSTFQAARSPAAVGPDIRHRQALTRSWTTTGLEHAGASSVWRASENVARERRSTQALIGY